MDEALALICMVETNPNKSNPYKDFVLGQTCDHPIITKFNACNSLVLVYKPVTDLVIGNFAGQQYVL